MCSPLDPKPQSETPSGCTQTPSGCTSVDQRGRVAAGRSGSGIRNVAVGPIGTTD